DHTVIVDDGLVRVVGPSGFFGNVLFDTQTIDGTGKYLAPGLADMHVHLTAPGDARLFLANGVTLVRNMWGQPWHLGLQGRVRRRELPGPHIVTTSPIVDGVNAEGRTVWPGSQPLTDPAKARELVRSYAERGYQQLKVYHQLTADSNRALAEAAIELGLRVTGHCPNGVTFEQAIANGQTCFEHLVGINTGHLKASVPPLPATPLTLHQQLADQLDLDAIARLAGHMAEQQVWNCLTTTVWVQPAQDEAIAMADGNLRFMAPSVIANWRRRTGMDAPPEQAERWAALRTVMPRSVEARFRCAKLLLDEGAPLLLGTDTPNPFVVPGFSIHQELANLVAAGFSPYEALRCGTTEAARFLGESAKWGAIAAGQRADLVLLARNPLQDVSAMARPEAVFVNGFYLDRAQLDDLLEEHLRLARAPLEAGPLESQPPDARIVRQGALANIWAGQENGRIAFRCCEFEHGGTLVDEARTLGPEGRATRRLWLGADLTVERSRDEYTSLAGEQTYELRWAEDSATYELVFTDADGHQERRSFGTQRLPPTWGLGLIALSELITRSTQPASIEALSVAFQASSPDDFGPVTMTIT
ncbi:MAG TPA: amidohydrolase family protein, partial [Chloroflexota bacterium]|nr:amidohydrolase family protein [Chloroflexota bacterium]